MLIDRLRQAFAAAALMFNDPPEPPPPADPLAACPRPSDELALRRLHTARAGKLKLIDHLKWRIGTLDAQLIQAREELRQLNWHIEDIEHGTCRPPY